MPAAIERSPELSADAQLNPSVDKLFDGIHSGESALGVARRLARATAEYPEHQAAADLARLVAETFLRIEIEALIEEAERLTHPHPLPPDLLLPSIRQDAT